MAINASATGQISFATSTGQALNTIVLPSVVDVLTDYTVGFPSVGTATATVVLPISPISLLYVYNGSAANTLNVNWTPQGASIETVITLQPLGSIEVCNAFITAVTLVASGVATPATVVVGG